MPVTTRSSLTTQRMLLPVSRLKPNPFSLSIYGDPVAEINDLLPSIRDHGVLVALVVAAGPLPGIWEVISGHRRLAVRRLSVSPKSPVKCTTCLMV